MKWAHQFFCTILIYLFRKHWLQFLHDFLQITSLNWCTTQERVILLQCWLIHSSPNVSGNAVSFTTATITAVCQKVCCPKSHNHMSKEIWRLSCQLHSERVVLPVFLFIYFILFKALTQNSRSPNEWQWKNSIRNAVISGVTYTGSLLQGPNLVKFSLMLALSLQLHISLGDWCSAAL